MYKNEFQIWLHNQGYYRIENSSVWYDIDGNIVSGEVLYQKLAEFKTLKKINCKLN